MNKLPTLLSVSDLRFDAAGVIKRTQKSEDGITFITQQGRASAVLLSLMAYERIQQIERDREQLLRLLLEPQETMKEEKRMARKWKATTGKKFLAALRRTGWTLTPDGEFIKATRAGLSHDITFGPDDTLRASLAEMWGSWLGIKPEDLE